MVALNILETNEWFGPVTVTLGSYGWRQQDLFALFGLSERTVTSAMVVGFFPGVVHA